MKTTVIAGIALILLGAFLLFRGGSFTSREEVLSVGPLSVTAEERHPISPWIGGAALVAGIGLAISGARRGA